MDTNLKFKTPLFIAVRLALVNYSVLDRFEDCSTILPMGNSKSKSRNTKSKIVDGVMTLKTSPLARQGVFGFFWGLGHFIDAFRQPSVLAEVDLKSATHVVVFGLAVWLMMKPSSTARIAILSAFNVLEAIQAMPIMPNHKMIFFMADSAILLSVLLFTFSSRRALTDWFAVSEPFLRLALFVTYGSATIAKLNTSWFDPQLSCSVIMPAREFGFLSEILGFEVPWASFWILPFIVAGVELLIWLTVLIPRIRPYTLVIAVLFHLSLSLTPVSQGLGFSFLLFPLLVLYLPDDAHQEIYRRGSQMMEWLRRRNLVILGSYLLIGVSVFLGYISLLSPAQQDRQIQSFLRYAPALLLLACFGAMIVYFAMKYRRSRQVSPAISIPSLVHLVLAILVVANSIAPYVGVKTYATMTMYSNLQMEYGKSNHLIIPRVPFETMVDDTVQILESSNTKLKDLANAGYRLTWHEFQRILSEDQWASVTFIRDGETFDLAQARDLPELVEVSPLHKLLGFRYVTDAASCLW